MSAANDSHACLIAEIARLRESNKELMGALGRLARDAALANNVVRAGLDWHDAISGLFGSLDHAHGIIAKAKGESNV